MSKKKNLKLYKIVKSWYDKSVNNIDIKDNYLVKSISLLIFLKYYFALEYYKDLINKFRNRIFENKYIDYIASLEYYQILYKIPNERRILQ